MSAGAAPDRLDSALEALKFWKTWKWFRGVDDPAEKVDVENLETQLVRETTPKRKWLPQFLKTKTNTTTEEVQVDDDNQLPNLNWFQNFVNKTKTKANWFHFLSKKKTTTGGGEILVPLSKLQETLQLLKEEEETKGRRRRGEPEISEISEITEISEAEPEISIPFKKLEDAIQKLKEEGEESRVTKLAADGERSSWSWSWSSIVYGFHHMYIAPIVSGGGAVVFGGWLVSLFVKKDVKEVIEDIKRVMSRC